MPLNFNNYMIADLVSWDEKINQHSTHYLSKVYSFGNLALDQHGTDGEPCINLYEQELIWFIVSLQHYIILDGSTFWGSDIIMKCS